MHWEESKVGLGGYNYNNSSFCSADLTLYVDKSYQLFKSMSTV